MEKLNQAMRYIADLQTGCDMNSSDYELLESVFKALQEKQESEEQEQNNWVSVKVTYWQPIPNLPQKAEMIINSGELMSIGGRLQITRKNLGYTQTEFAEFLGVPQPSLSMYENNKNLPTTEGMINIAKKCNISLDWLCSLTGNANNILEIKKISDL
ncbi:MAG: helix-turn-helix transcriptional regulator [Clostridia bacterium]